MNFHDGLFMGSYQFFDVVFHDVLAAADAVRILFDGQFLGRALKAEEALDVQLGLLLKAGPLRVLRVDRVEANLIDDDPVGEGLVPGVDCQGSVLLVEGVSLAEEQVLDTHDLLEQVGSFNVELGSSVDNVDAGGLVNLLVDDLRFLDDGNHLAGGEPHLVGHHDQLEGLLVDTNGRLVVLNHLATLTKCLDEKIGVIKLS